MRPKQLKVSVLRTVPFISVTPAARLMCLTVADERAVYGHHQWQCLHATAES